MRLTDLSLMFSSAAIWRVLRCVSVAPSCEQISSSTRSMFGAVRTVGTDFGRPLPALRSAAYPVVSMRRHIFCTVGLLNFHSLYGYARIIAFAPHPCSRSVCIRILSACDTFPILTALTKCWILTTILNYLNKEIFIYTFVCQMNLPHCNVTDDIAFTLVLSFFSFQI